MERLVKQSEEQEAESADEPAAELATPSEAQPATTSATPTQKPTGTENPTTVERSVQSDDDDADTVANQNEAKDDEAEDNADKTVRLGIASYRGMLKSTSAGLSTPEHAKSIEYQGNGAYTLKLDVTGKGASTSTTDTTPIDIALVLDVSGSMNDDFGGRGSPSKISALKTAVNSFLDETAKTNDTIEDDNDKVKVSLVKYANQIGTATGADGCQISNFGQSDTGNCTQIVQELTTDAGLLKTSVNGLQAAGATYADAAMEVTQQALAGGRASGDYYYSASSATQLAQIFNDIQKTITEKHVYTGVSITDELSEYAKQSGIAYDKFTARTFDGKTFYKVTSGVTLNVTGGKAGFKSNKTAQVCYTTDDRSSCANYQHPVLQIPVANVAVTKEWPDVQPVDSTEVQMHLKGYDDAVDLTVTLNADLQKPLKTYECTVRNQRNTVALQDGVKLSKKTQGNDYAESFDFELTDIASDKQQPADDLTAAFVSRYISVASLPAAGDLTGRQWLLIGGCFSLVAVVAGIIVSIRSGKKRLY